MFNDQIQIEQYCSNGRKKAIMINSLRNYLARRNSTILWGNGFTFNSENQEIEKFIELYVRKYRIQELALYIEEQVSKFGRAVITLQKTGAGEIIPFVCDNMGLAVFGKVSYYTEEVAVIWQRLYIDQTHYYIKTTYDRFKVVNEMYEQGDNNVVLTAYDTAIKLMKENRIEPVWEHNLGFVPVVEIGNFPNLFPFPNGINWNQQADWYNARLYEELFYQAYTDFKKELVLCHSRIGVENAPQQLIQSIQDKIATRMDLDKDDYEYTIDDMIIETGIGGKVSVINGTGDFTRYAVAMDAVMDFYCKFANSSRFSELSGGAQKSSSEVKTSRTTLIESINTKKVNRENKFIELFNKILAAYGMVDYFGEQQFTFTINGNIEKDDTAFLDNLIKQVSLGTMSVVECIAKLRNLSLTKANDVFEKIKEFNDANGIITNISDMGDNVEFDQDDGGRPEESGNNE